MQTIKRLSAALLTVAIVLGDCGSIPVSATENTTSEAAVSENSTIPEESPSEQIPAIEEESETDDAFEESPSVSSEDGFDEEDTLPDQDTTSETETETEIETETESESATEPVTEEKPVAETEFPALHIGRIAEDEELPSPDDSDFSYDLPVSFDESDNILLFTNYSIDTTLKEEDNGTLVFSVLRGEKGAEAGSANLLEEEDDWIGFEEVDDTPYFTMTENDDMSDIRYQTVTLDIKDISVTSAEPAAAEEYDYYIRAAYYPEADKDEAFYSAATVPFLPVDNTLFDVPADVQEENASDMDKVSDPASDTESISENTLTVTDEEAPYAETDAVETGMPEFTDSEPVLEDDSNQEDINAVSENSLTVQVEEALSSLSESAFSPKVSTNNAGVLTLSAEHVTLHPFVGSPDDIYDEKTKGRLKVTATVLPGDPLAKITWKSEDVSVATVDDDGIITAVAEGVTQITATCGDLTASVKVVVVEPDDNEVYDISGDIWVDGFLKESDDFVYTGQKITQNIRVYHKETLLTEKTDYTLSYKNNINAAKWNTAKAPSVTINLKGQYSGSVTLYYTIHPIDLKDVNIYRTSEDDAATKGYEMAVTYGKNLKIPNPALTFGKKNLAVNKDFVCDYSTLPSDYKKGDSYEAGKIYTYTINGIGNFTGSIPMRLVVVKEKGLNFSSASVSLGAKQYEYGGTALSKSDVTVETVKLNNQILSKNLYDYEVCADNIDGAYVMVYPTPAGEASGYRGCKKINLKLVGDRNIQDAVPGANWKEVLPFSQKILDENGGIFQETEGLLKFGAGNEALREGTDYTVKYGNTKKAGKVTVTFTGKGRYKGTLKLKYEITPNTDSNHFSIHWKNVIKENGTLATPYQKGGATPDFFLKDQDNNTLKPKTDYTVKYKDNKTPGQLLSCEITGKGNYKGYAETVKLLVTHGDIGKATLSAPDKAYSPRSGAWKSAVTIKDGNGKKLSAGTDYEKELVYTYAGMESGQPPKSDTVVTVTANGMECYAGSVISGTYRIFDINISKLQFVIDSQEYTGKEITLEKKDIHVYASTADKKNKIELAKPCYEIVEYKNNCKAGTAKVTFRGIGDYGGTKTCSFKIQKKAYLKNSVTGIKLDKTALSLSLQEKDEEKRILTATITVQTQNQTITNPTVIWSSSNNSVAVVETGKVNGTTITGIITARKEGSATITAMTQDGSKKAQCKLTIVDSPVLKEAGETIKKNVGETYQLTLSSADSGTAPSDVVWESSNPGVVSVSSTGLLKMEKAGAAVIKVYRKSKPSYVQQCYAIAIGDEKEPEGDKILKYEQKPGTTDDTPEINKMLRDWEWGDPDRYEALYIPAGVYHIDPVAGGNDKYGKYKFGGIVLTDNQKLIMSESALLIATGNSSKNYQIIHVFGRNNVTISGGQVIGERSEHTGKDGEWGHGIAIFGSTNVTIENVDVSQCWGDGIYLGKYDNSSLGNPGSNGVTITNCNLHHNRRNNLSITDASNITVKNSEFSYASGTAPQYGIDIEPNKNKTCSNVTISDCTFKGNAGGTIQILGQLDAHVKNVTIENCTGDKAPVIWQGFGGSVSGVTQKGNKW